MQKLRDATNKRIALLEEQKAEADRQRDELKAAFATTEGEIETHRRECENERKVR